MNEEQYLESPWDERIVRLEMREQCVGKFQSAQINEFFDDSVGPAVRRFSNSFAEIIGPEADYFELHVDGGFAYHEGRDYRRARLEDDAYAMRDLGVHVTTKEWLFYYHVYAMTPLREFRGPYCVFIKCDAEYRFIRDLAPCTKDTLYEDAKRSFLEARPS
ncbi:MAG TPA: hypothetical protein VEG65_06140 [Candidatus Bathyarchaeia archaeon]|nr:hypothetical protein [Candidatus Bathyarchaeia archaeon]